MLLGEELHGGNNQYNQEDEEENDEDEEEEGLEAINEFSQQYSDYINGRSGAEEDNDHDDGLEFGREQQQ